MTKATIIVPAYNVEATLAETVTALIAQTYDDFEIIIIDDGSQDRTPQIAGRFLVDPRVHVVRQPNRGLAGARNSGIAAARGTYIGFCDADDIWEPGKLAAHVAHLEANPHVGISFSGSRLIDEAGRDTGMAQRPRLTGITPAHVFKRNPIGNGSTPVIRRAALEAIAWRPRHETLHDWVFDETFSQSEDIECWLRLILSTDWEIEGIPGLLTCYRVNSGGLSSATDRQYAAWTRMIEKLTPLSPAFFAQETPVARAYQLRYLARRAISDRAGNRAAMLIRRSFSASLRPLIEEPVKTCVTLGAAIALRVLGNGPLSPLFSLMVGLKSPAPRV